MKGNEAAPARANCTLSISFPLGLVPLVKREVSGLLFESLFGRWVPGYWPELTILARCEEAAALRKEISSAEASTEETLRKKALLDSLSSQNAEVMEEVSRDHKRMARLAQAREKVEERRLTVENATNKGLVFLVWNELRGSPQCDGGRPTKKQLLRAILQVKPKFSRKNLAKELKDLAAVGVCPDPDS